MHVTLLKCKCDAMHDDLKPFEQKPIPKIAQKLQTFEKTPTFIKNPKS